MLFDKENRLYTLNGILFVALFGFAAMYIGEMPWLHKIGLGPLVIAMLFGIIYSNTLYRRLPIDWNPGIEFVSRKILRIAIVLYGFRITFQEILFVGLDAFLIDCIVVVFTLSLGYFIGVKYLKLDKHIALLISAGAAICGVAAILAVEEVIQSDRYKATLAIATVILFSTISMFFYPFLQHLGLFGFTQIKYGLYIGATVHELGQALVAGVHLSKTAGNVSLIVKVTRIIMLAPILIIIASLNPSATSKRQHIQKLVPWFAILFILVIGFNSLNLLPESVLDVINHIDTFLLAMVMAAVGMGTNLKKIQEIGLKPFYLGTFLFFWLMISVYLLVRFSPIH